MPPPTAPLPPPLPSPRLPALQCGRGSDGRAEAAHLTATQLLAWLWDRLVGQQQSVAPGASPLPGFYRWAAAQQAAGKLEFEVKGEGPAADWMVEAAGASKLGAPPPGPAFPSGADEEAACAAPAADAR